MPGIQKLHLEDALEDSPQTRSLLGVFESDANLLYKYTTGLYRCFDRVLNAQRELCAATRGLSQQLKAYETQKFPLDNDDSILTDTLKQFSNYLDELSSVHCILAQQCEDRTSQHLEKFIHDDLDREAHLYLSSVHRILAEQLADGMMHPLSKFLQADLETIRSMQEMMKLASSEHELAIQRYMKLPKKKDNEKVRQEANDDLYVKRKGYHQTALHYHASLNAVQYKRKCFLIEPMLGYVHAQKAFFSMGNEALCKKEVDDFLGNMNASVQGVHQEMGQETQHTVDLIDRIESESIHLYYAEPPQELPPNPPKLNLTQKAGFLFLRSKQALMSAKWERAYFFIQGGNIMCQQRDEVAGSLILDLNEQGTVAEPVDLDDRRFTFQVLSPVNKKLTPSPGMFFGNLPNLPNIGNLANLGGNVAPSVNSRAVVLQAENEREKEEWMATINNVVKEGGYIKEKSVRKKERSASGGSQSKTASTPPGQGTKDAHKDSRGASAAPPPTPPTSADSSFTPDAPIQFDMISPNEEIIPFKGNSNQGPPKRINPFDQAAVSIHSTEGTENPDFIQTFEVRFLGSMEVKSDRGESLVSETIRQIMAARALHNIFKTTDSNLVVSSQAMSILDPSNNSPRATFRLQDISFWASHKENKRLFGFITRIRGTSEGVKSTFNCHVFECNTSGDEICHAISTATKLAFQALMERKAMDKKTKEKDILMANIGQLQDNPDEMPDPQVPRLSADGQYLLLDSQTDAAAAADLNPPITHHRGDGDERRVEGAECESEA